MRFSMFSPPARYSALLFTFSLLPAIISVTSFSARAVNHPEQRYINTVIDLDLEDETFNVAIDTGAGSSMMPQDLYLAHYTKFPMHKEDQPRTHHGIGGGKGGFSVSNYIEGRIDFQGTHDQVVSLLGKIYITDALNYSHSDIFIGTNILEPAKTIIAYGGGSLGQNVLRVNGSDVLLRVHPQ
ncbi:hypothetical protein B0J14DRAFT_638807 [Halenospora varia]|nr:hypothetical protein B0J14DRAFT_638807 [Halenospora varia]